MPLNGHKLDGSSHHLLAALKTAVRDAILVMLALPDGLDPRRYQLRSMWLPVADDPGLAYAYTEVKTPRLVPSPKDITRAEIVDSWLVWLRAEEGKRAVHRVFHWARGVPTWMQAQRENCSGRTVLNRIDRSMAAILREFYSWTSRPTWRRSRSRRLYRSATTMPHGKRRPATLARARASAKCGSTASAS
jgi:hypothetical protein